MRINTFKQIKLTQGKYALVSNEDFEFINQWKWTAKKFKYTYYAIRRPYINGKRIIIQMHRVIMKTPINKEVDHFNHNGLDNRKENLKNVSRDLNQQNRKLNKNNKSGCKGVCWIKRFNKYVVHININHKKITKGYFKDLEKAIQLRKELEKLYYV